MTAPTPECPVCRVRMEAGFVPDAGQHGVSLSQWTEGLPEKTRLSGLQVKGRRQITTVTFRCPKCGWLIWFAPEPAAESG
jgi:hypothetical protein